MECYHGHFSAEFAKVQGLLQCFVSGATSKDINRKTVKKAESNKCGKHFTSRLALDIFSGAPNNKFYQQNNATKLIVPYQTQLRSVRL